MEKLKKLIEQYKYWSKLSVFIERIEMNLAVDFSISMENTKSLLEAVGKEICKYHGKELVKRSTVQGIVKNAFSAMGYSNDHYAIQISTALGTIAQHVATIRNQVGTNSHGKTLDQLEERNNMIDEVSRDLLIDSTELTCCFLIRMFENQRIEKVLEEKKSKLEYFEAADFNEYWDDQYGEFTMAEYSYAASEILYNVDEEAFLKEYKNFKENSDDKN